MKRVVLFIVVSLTWIAAADAATPDYEREGRLVEEMTLNLFEGEIVTLNDGERDFAGVWLEADDARGTVILLHGRGYHADWQDVVGPVRVLLAESGWNTLSLQMPVLETGARYYDYWPLFPESDRRIDAGIAWARQAAEGPLILLGHSCGAHMSMHWVSTRGGADAVDALVFAGLGATDWGQELVEPYPFEAIEVPVLDAIGALEYERVLKMADERRAWLAEVTHPDSIQVRIEGADHYFKDRNRELGEAVVEWLQSLDFGR